MYLTDAVDTAFTSWTRNIEMRSFLKDDRYTDYDIRGKMQIMPVFRFLVFFYYCIEPRSFPITTDDYDDIVNKCAGIRRLHKKIVHFMNRIKNGANFTFYVTEMKPFVHEMKITIDEIIYKLVELYPQLINNFNQLSLILENDCKMWRSRIDKKFFEELPEITELKEKIVNIVEAVVKIKGRLAEASHNGYIDIVLYIVMNYPFMMGGIYLMGAYLNAPNLWQSPDKEIVSEITASYNLIASNIDNIPDTITKCKKSKVMLKGYDNPENRVHLMNTIRDKHDIISIAFYNMLDKILPLLPNPVNAELDTKVIQYTAVINEMKEFKEDVMREDKKRNHSSISKDDALDD